MDVKTAIESRRSIRKYKDQPVEEEKLWTVLEAARLAPTGSNTQSGRFIVIRDEAMKEQVAQASHQQTWMLTAPVFIAFVVDATVRLGQEVDYVDEQSPQFELKQSIRDVAIQCDHASLQAQALGLSTCWVGWFLQAEIRPVLKLPDHTYLVAILTLGYADQAPKARPRKPLEELVHWESWQDR